MTGQDTESSEVVLRMDATPILRTDSFNGNLPLNNFGMEALDRESPKWRRIRIGLIIVFWIVWIGLIASAAVLIVLTPRCPARPSQGFYQSNVAYWVNLYSFKDSNQDLIGDIKGLELAADYIQNTIGAGFVILTSLSPFFPKNLKNFDHISFRSIHPKLGTMEDFSHMLRNFGKRGLKTIISLNFNVIPTNHELAIRKYLIETACETPKYCETLPDGSRFYSSYEKGSGLVDLNHLSPEVLEEIKNATRFWLLKGVDGIMLTDAAYYVKEDNCNSLSCMTYKNETITVIQELRKVVDEISLQTMHPRVLIADSGSTGASDDGTDKSQCLLGTQNRPGAHLSISRQFAYNRGANYKDEPSCEKYSKSVSSGHRGQLGLIVASPSDRPYASLLSTASALLLPGTPIIYAGSELGNFPKPVALPTELYPFGQKSPFEPIVCHLPMPWDSHGTGFSSAPQIRLIFEKYVAGNHINETVESAVAVGRGPNIFKLVRDLVKLRKEYPSLQWGEVDFNLGLHVTESVKIFMRAAAGFESIIVAFVKGDGSNSVVNFNSHCTSIVPLIIYPPKEEFVIGAEISTAVFFKSTEEDAIYVFKCIA